MDMKKKAKIIIPVAVVVIAVVIVVSMMVLGKKSGEPAKQSQPVVTQAAISNTATPEPTVDPHEGKVQSNLTGEWISKKKANKRPFAIMINNIEYASLNQKGTSKADIMYEALAEGGITRMMAVYQDPSKVEAIGSVRSARHYFVSFASEWDAIFCHFGQTKYAISKMEELGVENLSGLSGIGSTVYARTSALREPHNVFASGKNMIKGAKMLKYSLKRNEEKVAKHFFFYDEDTELDSEDAKKATKVTLPFSTYSTPYFTYDKKSGEYKKFEYNTKHMDRANNTQLSFKNIIVQLVRESNIDKNGYQTMSIHKRRGDGYYITNGKVVKIEWTKNEEEGRMCYFDKNGKVLKINTGKTYIAAFPLSEKKLIKFN